MYYWEVMRDDELGVDIDCRESNQERLVRARARLIGAYEAGTLDVDKFVFYESETEFHYHLIVKLKKPMDAYRRILWEGRLYDDFQRNQLNLARLLEYGKSMSLLITPFERRTFWRKPDYMCPCKSKHKPDIMATCPVAQHLDCCLAADHFGKPVYDEREPILGKVVKL